MKPIPPEYDNDVHQLILKVRKLMLRSRLLRGLLIWLTVSLGLWLVLLTVDNLLHLPAGLRLAVSLGGLGLMGFEFWQLLLRPVIRSEKLESVTLFLEDRFSIPENMLVNSLCFESAWLRPGEEPFARETIRTGSEMMTKANVNELWQHKKLARWATALLILIIMWAFYGISRGHQVANALLRYAMPLGDVPPAGSVVLKVTPSGDVFMAEGDNLDIRVEVKGLKDDDSLAQYPEIIWQRASDYVSDERGKNKTTTMQSSAEGRNLYHYTFKSVSESFAFRVFAADTYTQSTKVTVNMVPRITESEFHILAPSYTGTERISLLGPPEALTGPAGSDVAIDVKLNKSAEGLWYKDSGDWIAFENNSGLWRAKTKLRQAESYRIEVKAKGFEKRIKIAEAPVLAQQDRRPEVEFVTSELNRRVNLGERLRLDIQAYDDFGASRIYVTHKSARTDSSESTIESWDYQGPPGKTESRETLLLSIDASLFKPGGSYILQAFCEDFSPAGNTGSSKPLMLQVKSLEEMTLSEDDPSGNAFAELDKAIKAQQTALGVTVNLTANLDDVVDSNRTDADNLASLKSHLTQMEQKQGIVGSHMTRASEVSIEPKPEFVVRLIELRDNEHKRILGKIAETGQNEKIDNSSASFALKSIEKQQAFLLDQLIALKGIVAKQSQIDAEKAMAELLGETDESLSQTPEETLENTLKELDGFVKEQKNIMEKRQMVLDQPPEDFSEEDEQVLEDLAIDQSKLAEILSNVVNDLSNMNLLDFGDTQMVESMKSVHEKAEELADKAEEAAEMRQAREDAYRLETEAVEMAEELMINCEATMGFYDNIQFVAEIPEDEQLRYRQLSEFSGSYCRSHCGRHYKQHERQGQDRRPEAGGQCAGGPKRCRTKRHVRRPARRIRRQGPGPERVRPARTGIQHAAGSRAGRGPGCRSRHGGNRSRQNHRQHNTVRRGRKTAAQSARNDARDFGDAAGNQAGLGGCGDKTQMSQPLGNRFGDFDPVHAKARRIAPAKRWNRHQKLLHGNGRRPEEVSQCRRLAACYSVHRRYRIGQKA